MPLINMTIPVPFGFAVVLVILIIVYGIKSIL